MILDKDEFYLNDTFKFIFPILRMYGNDYMINMKELCKQGVFIDDLRHIHDEKDRLYIVINTKMMSKSKTRHQIAEILDFFKKKDYFFDLYILDVKKDDKTPHRIVLVLDIPKQYQGIFYEFVNGKYESMYCVDDINTYFKENMPQNKAYFDYIRSILLSNKPQKKPNIENEVLNF